MILHWFWFVARQQRRPPPSSPLCCCSLLDICCCSTTFSIPTFLSRFIGLYALSSAVSPTFSIRVCVCVYFCSTRFISLLLEILICCMLADYNNKNILLAARLARVCVCLCVLVCCHVCILSMRDVRMQKQTNACIPPLLLPPSLSVRQCIQ